jgi:superfamily II DNA/RNA helicase
MRHPVNIRAESSSESQTVPTTAQFVYRAHDLDKPEVVARILQAEDLGKVLIFARTKRAAQRVADDLSERGFPASPLHGDMAQVAREKAMARFRDGRVQIVVATDVAARGIDVEGVSHVINYHCPDDSKTYLHRIGRTGRAGASGIAVTFVDWADLARWKVIASELDLPFTEPEETYSTSAHLYHDLGIPPGVTGRLVPPTDQPARPSTAGRSGGRSRGRTDAPAESGDRPRRSRQRQRTRGGKPVDGAAADPGQTPASAGSQPAAQATAASTGQSSTATDTAPAREGGQRRRRRRRGGGSGEPASGSS